MGPEASCSSSRFGGIIADSSRRRSTSSRPDAAEASARGPERSLPASRPASLEEDDVLRVARGGTAGLRELLQSQEIRFRGDPPGFRSDLDGGRSPGERCRGRREVEQQVHAQARSRGPVSVFALRGRAAVRGTSSFSRPPAPPREAPGPPRRRGGSRRGASSREASAGAPLCRATRSGHAARGRDVSPGRVRGAAPSHGPSLPHPRSHST